MHRGRRILDPAVVGTRLRPEDVAGLDAVLLIKRTGVPLGVWARDSIDLDVVSVMSATLLGSVDTIAQAVHGEVAPTLAIASDGWQFLATRLESQAVLVLLAPGEMRQGELRRRSRAIAGRIASKGDPPRPSIPDGAAAPSRAAVAMRSR